MGRSRTWCLPLLLVISGPGIRGVRATDCNANGILDLAEVQTTAFVNGSPNMAVPLGGGIVTHTIVNPPAAGGNVSFAIEGSNVGPTKVSLYLNDQLIEVKNWPGGFGCANRALTINTTAAVFNARPNGPNAVLLLKIEAGAGCILPGTVRVVTRYDALPIAPDCNGNLLPDVCDIVPDLNPAPSGGCAAAQPVCPGFTYRLSCENGGTDLVNIGCATSWTSGNVYFAYTPSDDGVLQIHVAYDNYRGNGLQPTVYVYSGCPISFQNLLQCAHEPLTVNLNVNVTRLATYYIRVAKSSTYLGDDFSMTLTGPPCLTTGPRVGGPSDCNGNAVPDSCDLASGLSGDCNANGQPDECEADCNANHVPDSCDLASGAALDCNANDIPDSCDIAAGGGSDDCNNNQRPDECDLAAGGGSDDCNANRVPDECDYAAGTLHDCNANQQADACELSPCRYETELVARTPPGPDPTVLGPPDGIGHDIQGMSLTFRFTCGRLYNGPGPDLNIYEVPGGHGLGNLANQVQVSADGVTWYDISQAFAHAGATHIPGDGYRPAGSYSLPSVLRQATYVRISYYGVAGFGIVLDAIGAIHAWVPDDCNGNGSPDGCDLGAGISTDADGNGKPDECDADCDGDGVPNSFELAFGLELDCNANNVPDNCEPDCDGDGVPDVCEPNNNLILRADAGPDGSICAGESLVLGGSPSAVNGVAPYAYQWFADGQPKEPPALDQQQLQATGDVFTGGAAQTFIAGQTGELRAIEVWFSADSGSGTLFIHAGNYGTLLSVQGVNAPAGWQRFELNCPVPVTAGQEYMLRLTGALNIKYHAGNPYPAGMLNGNNFWDMAFKTYVGRLTGLCGGAEANPTVRPVQTTRYQLQVTDADHCRQMDEVLVTVRPEPCLRLSGFTVGGERPYVLGQVVPVTVNLSVPAPAGGVDVVIDAGGFAGFLMHVPEGLDGSQRDVTMQSLGIGLSATARIVGLGAPVSSSTYDVLPMVQSLALESLPPYRVGDALPLSVTLREPAIAGGAVVRVTSPAFDPFDINIPEGQTQGQGQAVLRVVGSGLTATAAGQTRCARTAVSAPFDVLPAGELYVDAVTGSDANDGLTPGTALATISQALALAAEGFVIHVAAGNYPERLVVNKNVVLAGAGADRTVVDAGHSGRPLAVHAPSVTISDMAFTNGTTTGDFFDAVGGGVYVGAVNDLLLRRCHIHGNTAGGPGGGIYVSFAGQVSLVDCTISHNTGGVFGGGIFSYATLRLTQCTVSGNALGAAELGNSFGGGVVSAGETYISHCTITGNSAAIGGGISPWNSVRLGHTLVAGNVSPFNIGPDLDDSFNAVFISEGYNLIGTAPPMAAAAGDLFGIEPMLAPLALYGGTVPTHALRSGSPAIDAGNPADCADLGGAPAALDQRGRNRPFDGDGDGQPRCDIGAFERTSPPADFDGDEDVDATDLEALRACLSAPAIPRSPPCQAQDLDGDNDVDQTDHALFQRCYNGKDRPPAPTCGT